MASKYSLRSMTNTKKTGHIAKSDSCSVVVVLQGKGHSITSGILSVTIQNKV